MTPTEFKVAYPEFKTAPDAVVEAAIADQSLLVSDAWGNRRETVLGLRVADALAKTPAGRNGRLNITSESAPLENPYSKQLAQYQLAFGWANNRV